MIGVDTDSDSRSIMQADDNGDSDPTAAVCRKNREGRRRVYSAGQLVSCFNNSPFMWI